ncbi:MAG TPA: 2-phospho-L-lactate transferase [Methanosarcinaceae archaeon]|nr:2-phospho-L-lactate transferase [Methanosarcinaceae archaeon]
MIILSGGTGTPKLLNGLRKVIPQENITVVVNTAEDIWVSGNLVTPDIDTVLYLLSGRIDTGKWWGVAGDTFRTHETMISSGFNEGMMIGDLDRATHIIRSDVMRNGGTLTSAIRKLCGALSIKADVLPMSDDPVSTIITTPQGKIHYQDFWVRDHGEPDVLDVSIDRISDAAIAPAVLEALGTDDDILIGPSNPITSIGPILALPGMREILKLKKVIAVSPIIGKEPVSGPAGKLMRACGYDVSSVGVLECYQDIVDVFVIDERDTAGVADFGEAGCKIVRADTLMKSVNVSVELAKRMAGIFEGM